MEANGNSITQPDLPFVKEQWAIKQGFAVQAERASQELLRKAIEPVEPTRPT